MLKAISRADGCTIRSVPDPKGKNKDNAADFIVDCTAQEQLYILLTAAMAAI